MINVILTIFLLGGRRELICTIPPNANDRYRHSPPQFRSAQQEASARRDAIQAAISHHRAEKIRERGRFDIRSYLRRDENLYITDDTCKKMEEKINHANRRDCLGIELLPEPDADGKCMCREHFQQRW